MESNNINKYEDQEKRKVITNSLLNIMIFRSLFLQASFNYERMQACGWLYGLIPGLKAIHKNENDLKKSMKMHLEFFNTHPFLVNFIQGLVLAMEENKEDVETIRGIKVATMGPLGGIGDSIFWLTILPIAAGIGASFAQQGNIVGPIFFILIYGGMQLFLRFFLMYYGYRTGVSAVASLKENTQKIARAATIVGVTVVGALVASYISINVKTTIKAGEAVVSVQNVLDSVMPALLPALYTYLMLVLIRKKISPVKLVFITLIIGIICSYLKVL